MRRTLTLVLAVVAAGACSQARSPGAARQWRRGAEMPTPRTEVAAGVLGGGRVIVAGGFTRDGRASAVVEVYDPARDRWSAGAPLPKPVHHAALVDAGPQLFLIGGYGEDGAPTDEVWVLADAEGVGSAKWRAGPRLPLKVGALAAAAFPDRIYIAGGATGLGSGARLTDQAHSLDLRESAVWNPLPSVPEARDHLAAGILSGKTFVVVGGRRLSLETNTTRVDLFDREAGTWREGPPLSTARGGFAAGSWNGRVYAAGGERPSGTIDSVEILDVDAGRWQRGPRLGVARHGLAAAWIDGRFLAFVGGGRTPGLSVSGVTELLEEPRARE